MPSTSNKSPYAASFKSAINRGTPASKAVEAIADRYNTRPAVVFNSLHKADLCHRQKFNGQWIYWPSEGVKTSATNAKAIQLEIWQYLIDWCIVSGQCKPEQLDRNAGSQQEFMSYCKKFWNRQYGSTVSKSRARSSRATRATATKRSTATYQFAQAARRYRRAA